VKQYRESLSWRLNFSKVSVIVSLCDKFSSEAESFVRIFLWGDVGPACREDEISQKSTLQFFGVVNLEVSRLLRIYTCEVMLSQLVEAASTHLDETHTKFLKVNSMVTLHSKLSTELFFENFSSKPLVYTLMTRMWISRVTHVYVSYRIYAWLTWCCHHHTLWWHTYEWVLSYMWIQNVALVDEFFVVII